MPIKVTYQDSKGNPLSEEEAAPPPISTDEKDRWEEAQGEMYKRGIYEDDLLKPEGIEVLQEFGIDPKRVPDFLADIQQKAEKQKEKGTLPEVATGITSKYADSDLAEHKRRYVHYAYGDHDFGTDIDAFLKYADEKQKKEDAEWVGFGDPTKDVNYRAPGVLSGFGSAPGVAASTTPIKPDPRFPTRDERTGRVTPAVVQPILVSDQGENDARSVARNAE